MSRISGSSRASKLMGRAGDGSTLSLDFTAMGSTIDSRITFSRADATPLATFINSSGFVETVATAQAPRFDYVGGVAKGLLLEAPATNIARRTDDFNTAVTDGTQWISQSYTAATLSTQLPTGSTGNARRISIVTGSASFRSSPLAVTASTQYTFSFWARNNGGSQARYRVWDATAGSSIVDYTLSGSNYVSLIGGANITSSVWVRVSVTFTTPVGCISIFIYPSSSDSGSVDLLIWGAQLELGPQASSYISTTNIAVTRAVDTAIIAAGSNFSSWYTGGTTGTFVANWYGNASSATARTVIATNDVLTQHLHMYQTASALTLRLADFNAVATVTTANSLTAGALAKGAFSYNGTATSLCLNGGTVATGTLAFSAAPTWLSIGGPSTSGTSITTTTVMLNNSIRTIKYFPARLSDGQIQGLTT
jgi:hypothetical protein